MRKLFIVLLILSIPATCGAYALNLGTFGNNTYILQTDSLRFCSTTDCLFIRGQEQQYVAAKITVYPKSGPTQSNEDVLSYNKTLGFSEKAVLFARDGSQFVLIQTATYDVNGNPIDVKNETEEKKTFVSNEFSASTNKNGVITSEQRSGVDVYTRNVAWSTVFPGTPGEAITRAVLSYAESNYDSINESSSGRNYIQVGR